MREALRIASATAAPTSEVEALLEIADDARGVHVGYWGRGGQTDSLTATSLATLDQLNAVALALSSALIDRHRNDDVVSAVDSARARLFTDPRAPGVLYAMISAAPRTNVRLRVEDF